VKRHRRWWATWLGIFCFGGIALVVAWPRITALRFIARMAYPGGFIGKLARVGTPTVAEDSEFSLPTRHGPMAARLFRARDNPGPAIIVVPGIHKDGVREVRLASLARELVAAGFLVVAVAPSDLPRYRIDPRSTDQLEDGIRFVAGRKDWVPSERVAILGVSFAGGLAVVAAGRPEARERVSAVLSFGGYGDLGRVLRYLCTGNPGMPPRVNGLVENASHIHVSTPNEYGAVAALLSLADHLVPPEQVDPLRTAVTIFLEGSSLERLDHGASQALFARSRALGQALPEPGRGLVGLVNDRKARALGQALAPLLGKVTLPAALSPERSDPPKAPLFLLHGADDSVVPATEMLFLASAWKGRIPVTAFASQLISHADLGGKKRWSEIWGLSGFWSAFLAQAR
jgi:dienelactone hydrolase